MKLRNKLAAITAAAMLAFTGVGFAAWTFTNTVDTDNASGTPQIMCAVELNDDLELHNATGNAEITGLYLICDAPESGLNALAGHGVYWSTTNDATAYSNKVTDAYISGSVNFNKEDIKDITSVDVEFTSSCTLANGTYVEFTGINTVPAVKTVTLPADTTAEVAYQSASFALPVPAYNASVNTTNFNDVSDVANITAGLASLILSYSAQIKAQA